MNILKTDIRDWFSMWEFKGAFSGVELDKRTKTVIMKLYFVEDSFQCSRVTREALEKVCYG